MLVRNCRSQLRSLSLSGCRGLRDGVGLRAIGGCKLLQSLDLSSCDVTDGAVHLIARDCVSLVHLELDFSSVGDEALWTAAPLLGRRLRHLSLHMCQFVTDAGVAALAQFCTGLEYLCLSFCRTLTDATLQSLHGQRVLQKLVMDGCAQLTANAARELIGASETLHLQVQHLQLLSPATRRSASEGASGPGRLVDYEPG